MPDSASPVSASDVSVHTLYKDGSARRIALITGLSLLVIATAVL
jgi:hypothetical protein